MVNGRVSKPTAAYQAYRAEKCCKTPAQSKNSSSKPTTTTKKAAAPAPIPAVHPIVRLTGALRDLRVVLAFVPFAQEYRAQKRAEEARLAAKAARRPKRVESQDMTALRMARDLQAWSSGERSQEQEDKMWGWATRGVELELLEVQKKQKEKQKHVDEERKREMEEKQNIPSPRRGMVQEGVLVRAWAVNGETVMVPPPPYFGPNDRSEKERQRKQKLEEQRRKKQKQKDGKVLPGVVVRAYTADGKVIRVPPPPYFGNKEW